MEIIWGQILVFLIAMVARYLVTREQHRWGAAARPETEEEKLLASIPSVPLSGENVVAWGKVKRQEMRREKRIAELKQQREEEHQRYPLWWRWSSPYLVPLILHFIVLFTFQHQSFGSLCDLQKLFSSSSSSSSFSSLFSFCSLDDQQSASYFREWLWRFLAWPLTVPSTALPGTVGVFLWWLSCNSISRIVFS